MGLFDVFKVKKKPPVKEEKSNADVLAGQTGVRSSRPSADYDLVQILKDTYLPLPDKLPFEYLHLMDTLARYNPSVSYAIEVIKNLINTGHKLKTENPKNQERINDLASRVNVNGGGMDGLVNVFAIQALRYGSICGEIILNEKGNDVIDIVPVMPHNIRFLYEDGKYIPVQLYNNEQIRLNPLTFFYFKTNQENDSPYGVSPLLSALKPAALQGLMLDSFEKMLKKESIFGQTVFTIDSTRLKQLPNETDDQFRLRIQNQIQDLKTEYLKKDPTEPIVVLDFIKTDLKSSTTSSQAVQGYFNMMNEMMANGSKVQSTIVNQTNGNTETYGTIQLEVQLRSVGYIQNSIKRAMEKCYDLALAVWGVNDKATVQFEPNRSVDRFKEAQAELMETNKRVMLYKLGVIDQQEFARLEGYDAPMGPELSILELNGLVTMHDNGGGASNETDGRV